MTSQREIDIAEFQRLHRIAVSQVAVKLGSGAEASVRQSHGFVQDSYNPLKPVISSRIGELPAEMQTRMRTDAQNIADQINKTSLSNMPTFYLISGVDSSTAEALVQLIVSSFMNDKLG